MKYNMTTVENPETNRSIKIGSVKYKELLKQYDYDETKNKLVKKTSDTTITCNTTPEKQVNLPCASNINLTINDIHTCCINTDTSINKIIHLSDIHIPLHLYKDRQCEYLTIFEKLYKSIAPYGGNAANEVIIVISGDLLNTKGVIEAETILLTKNFIKTLSSYYFTIIALGNHDIIYEGNNSRLDIISSICNDIPNVTVLRNTGLYRVNNILFCFSSLLDMKFIKYSAIMPTALLQHCIAIYHGSVKGAKMCNGTICNTPSYPSLQDFNGFDAVLLGHIHKHQALAPNIAYAGSLIQQNFGETINNHGYLIWSLPANNNIISSACGTVSSACGTVSSACGTVSSACGTVSSVKTHDAVGFTHIEIENDYIFLYIDVKDGVITESSLSTLTQYKNKNLRIKCKTSNTTNTQYAMLEEKLKTQYNVVSIGLANSLTSYNISNIFQANNEVLYEDEINLIKKECNIELENELIALHKDFYKNVQQNINRWNILTLAFKNILIYGNNKENYIDFVNGVNNICSKNNTGKTSIINAILYVLFHKTCDDSFNRYNMVSNTRKSGYITITFKCNGTHYKIHKELTSVNKLLYQTNTRCTVTFYKKVTPAAQQVTPAAQQVTPAAQLNTSDINTNLTSGTSAAYCDSVETDNYIDITSSDVTKTIASIIDIIGTFDNFIANNVISSKYTYNLLNIKSTERLEYFHNICNTCVYDAYVEKCKEIIKDLKKKIADTSPKIEVMGKLILSVEDINKYHLEQVTLDDELKNLKLQRDSYISDVSRLTQFIQTTVITLDEETLIKNIKDIEITTQQELDITQYTETSLLNLIQLYKGLIVQGLPSLEEITQNLKQYNAESIDATSVNTLVECEIKKNTLLNRKKDITLFLDQFIYSNTDKETLVFNIKNIEDELNAACGDIYDAVISDYTEASLLNLIQSYTNLLQDLPQRCHRQRVPSLESITQSIREIQQNSLYSEFLLTHAAGVELKQLKDNVNNNNIKLKKLQNTTICTTCAACAAGTTCAACAAGNVSEDKLHECNITALEYELSLIKYNPTIGITSVTTGNTTNITTGDTTNVTTGDICELQNKKQPLLPIRTLLPIDNNNTNLFIDDIITCIKNSKIKNNNIILPYDIGYTKYLDILDGKHNTSIALQINKSIMANIEKNKIIQKKNDIIDNTINYKRKVLFENTLHLLYTNENIKLNERINTLTTIITLQEKYNLLLEQEARCKKNIEIEASINKYKDLLKILQLNNKKQEYITMFHNMEKVDLYQKELKNLNIDINHINLTIDKIKQLEHYNTLLSQEKQCIKNVKLEANISKYTNILQVIQLMSKKQEYITMLNDIKKVNITQNELTLLNQNITDINILIDNKVKLLNICNYNIYKIERQMEQNKEYLTEHDKLLNENIKNEKLLTLYKEYERLFSKGNIPFKILVKKLDTFIQIVNKILITYTKYNLNYDYTDKGKLIFYLTDTTANNIPCDLNKTSGFESIILQICMNCAINSVIKIPTSELFIIDEKFDCMDVNRFNTDLENIIKLLYEGFSTIILISHRQVDKVLIDKNIIIKNNNIVSWIE